jgi:sugar O-acyltransferase (sialic acid O-acetyltransferase NeuD family)
MAPAEPARQTADPAVVVTPRPVLLIGGGEHAGVVLEAIGTAPDDWYAVGFTDPEAAAGVLALDGTAHLGDDPTGLGRFADLPAEERPALILAVGGVGEPGIRRRLSDTIGRLAPDARWAVVVHASAWVSPTASLGEGTVVLAGAVVNAGARIGRQAIVNSRAVVEHDTLIGAFSHVGPGAVVGGGTRVGSDVTIGMGALVRDHLVVGDGATIGMGAVVVRDVEPGTTVLGSPARPRIIPEMPGGTA